MSNVDSLLNPAHRCTSMCVRMLFVRVYVCLCVRMCMYLCSDYLPSNWSPMTERDNLTVVLLDSASQEFKNVEQNARKTAGTTINRIAKVDLRTPGHLYQIFYSSSPTSSLFLAYSVEILYLRPDETRKVNIRNVGISSK